MRTSGSREVRPGAAVGVEPLDQPLPQLPRRPPAADQHQRALGFGAGGDPGRDRGQQQRGLARARTADHPQRAGVVGQHPPRGRVPDRLRPGRPRPAHQPGRQRGRAGPGTARRGGGALGSGHARMQPRPTDTPVPTPSRDRRRRTGVSGVGGTIRGVTELHVRTYGAADGPAVLALHGVTGHAARWRVLAEALPELRLIAVDLRGHGHSPWTPPWHLEQHVADALAVLDELGLDRVAVFGHSFGGAIAVHLARTAPDRVERLVLLDPAIGLDPQDMLETAEETRADESYPDLAAARADRAQRWPGVRRAGRGRAGREPGPGRRPLALPLQPGRGGRGVERDGPPRASPRPPGCRPCCCRPPRRTTSTRPGCAPAAPSWASGSPSARSTPGTCCTWSAPRWSRSRSGVPGRDADG